MKRRRLTLAEAAHLARQPVTGAPIGGHPDPEQSQDRLKLEAKLKASFQRHSNKRERERTVESAFTDGVAGKGGLSIKMRLIGIIGFPDQLVIWPPGVIELVELKRPDADLRPSQERFHKRLRQFGVHVPVLSTFEEVDDYLEDK